MAATPEGRQYSCRPPGGDSVVLVDEAAEVVVATDFADGGCWRLLRLRWLELERAVRDLGVVVVDEDA